MRTQFNILNTYFNIYQELKFEWLPYSNNNNTPIKEFWDKEDLWPWYAKNAKKPHFGLLIEEKKKKKKRKVT